MDVIFFQDLHVSLHFDPLGMKLKNHYQILVFKVDQATESQFPHYDVINLEFSYHPPFYPRIHRSYEGEMLQDDIDPRF